MAASQNWELAAGHSGGEQPHMACPGLVAGAVDGWLSYWYRNENLTLPDEESMTVIFPMGITANRETTELIIEWKDGHTSRIPFSLLRNACPCAECRGGHDKMGSTPPPEVFTMELEDSPRTHLNSIEAVGTYALNPYWEDGHQFGIFTWEYLRALCPCPICQEIEGLHHKH